MIPPPRFHEWEGFLPRRAVVMKALPSEPPKAQAQIEAQLQPTQLSPQKLPDAKTKHWDQSWVEAVLGCKNCRLCSTRKSVVLGEGSLPTQVVFVGEAPGEQEDLQGRPFVGAAGQLLTRMLAAIGLQREDVFIGNVIKCRPPGNRNPEPEEISACFPYLEHQLNTIAPKLIVTLGKFATATLLKQEVSITRVRGTLFDFKGSSFEAKLLPTFHPSYLLRNPSAKKEAWQDLKQVAALLGIQIPVHQGSPQGTGGARP